MLESTSEAPQSIDRNRLNSVEARMGVVFPESYRRFLLTYNGGRPAPSYFTAVENGELVLMRIHFFFGIDDPDEGCDLLWNYTTFTGRLPRHVIAVASDECGNRFCLDLRTQGNGRVLFWDHEREGAGTERALGTVVANSFEEWLGMLTARD
jgi:cell wall assembly regulator SMI1